jgi:hypothetical protein
MASDLWYLADSDRLWHAPAAPVSDGLMQMIALCGTESPILGDGLSFVDVPVMTRCMTCTLRHGLALADRRRADLTAMHGDILDGLTEAVEVVERGQIEGEGDSSGYRL